jgi:predicted AlkP superfamily phosphohydrolase/phosphomutase
LSKGAQKVLIIGLDGGTLDLILPWVQAGHLPALARLIGAGVSGPLESSFPPLTGPAWSSFITGKSPGHHGVMEFFFRKEGTYQQVLNNRQNIDGKSLWSTLSDSGKKVGIMGVPLTYPPEPVNGFLITGLLTPPGRRDFTYPRELLAELEDNLGTYQLRHDEKYRPSNPRPFIKEQYSILKNNTEAARYLIKNKPWDLFMVHILGTDRIQHEFWHVMDETHPQHDPAERQRLGNVILDFFKQVDASVDSIVELAGDANIIVMSDHGFGPVHKFINFNVWLLQQGYLRLNRDISTRLRYLLFRLGFNYSVLGQIILKLGLGKQAKELGRARREELQRRFFLSLNDVDWARSKVYSMGNFGQLYINLQGREPRGSVSPGSEYEALLDEVSQKLLEMVDPNSGLPVVEQIFRKDEVYQGPYTEKAPDLMFFTRNMEYKAMGLSDFSSNRVFEPVYGTTGHHRMNGLLVCHNPGVFMTGEEIHDARIQDIVPTILYLMDQPVPREMDGKVLLDLFTPEFRVDHQVRFTEDSHSGEENKLSDLTREEQEELTTILRDLGYVT